MDVERKKTSIRPLGARRSVYIFIFIRCFVYSSHRGEHRIDHLIICVEIRRSVMAPIGSNTMMNCSLYEIDHCLQMSETDFLRLGKLGGGSNIYLLSSNKRLISNFSGTYGDVFRVRHRSTGEIYALKQIRDEHEINGIPATAMREASILKQLDHENIIKLEEVFLTNDRCYFLLEYMDEDLKRYLDRNRPLERTIIQVEPIRS